MVFNHVAYIAATVYIVEIVGPSKEGVLKPVCTGERERSGIEYSGVN